MKRPRGMGTIYQRGRTWWFQAPGEKPESSGSMLKQDAEDMLKNRLMEARLGKARPDRGRTTYEDLERGLLADLRANGRRSVGNVEKYRLPHLREFFGGKLARDITCGMVKGYVARRLDTAARATVSQEVKHLKRMFRIAHQDETLDRIPAFPTVPVGDNARRGFCEPEQIESVITHLPEHAKAPVRCLYLTGWRTGEILGLLWRNVDFEAGLLRLDAAQTKSGKPRLFPFTAIPALAELIREQRERTSAEERERGAIIPNVFHYHGVALGSFRGAWRDAIKEAGLPDLRPHDLRRSAARNLVRAGVPEGVIMRLCGWSTRSMFDRYAVADTRDLVEGVQRLSGFLCRASVVTRVVAGGFQTGREEVL